MAKALQSFGASISIERKRFLPPIFLEFEMQGTFSSPLGLESSNLRRSPGGAWELVGRVKNLSNRDLEDIWALIQVFDEDEELITYEEIPIPINPLPPNETSPFKVLFEKELPIKKFSVGFKTASGNPIQSVDQRNKKEWAEVKKAETDQEGVDQPLEEFSDEVFSPTEHQILSISMEQEEEKGDEKREDELNESPFLEMEEILKASEGEIEFSKEVELGSPEEPSACLEEKGKEIEGEQTIQLEEPSKESTESMAIETVVEEEELHLDFPVEETSMRGNSIEPSFPISDGKAEEKSSMVEMKIEEPTAIYPWLNDFRKTIEAIDQTHIPPFLLWFQNLQREGSLEDPQSSLLVVLIYARFNQTSSSDSALENTQKVFQMTIRNEINVEDLPPLKGDLFFPSDVWRELYIRAIPKLKEVSHRILEKQDWQPSELDRLIRIIPHMTAKNSRWAIRTIHYWIPGFVPDISEMTVDIQEELYRVSSRLGVVHPLFDAYQGKHSMGEIKIQAFAKAAFPNDPLKIEGPMNLIGSKGENGYCLPTQPLCSQCPFEGFCGKLFLDFDPSEKGIVFRPL